MILPQWSGLHICRDQPSDMTGMSVIKALTCMVPESSSGIVWPFGLVSCMALPHPTPYADDQAVAMLFGRYNSDYIGQTLSNCTFNNWIINKGPQYVRSCDVPSPSPEISNGCALQIARMPFGINGA